MEIQEEDDFVDDRYAAVHEIDEEMDEEDDELVALRARKAKSTTTTTTTTSRKANEAVEILDVTGKAQKRLPLIEKYRPATLDDVVAQDDIVQTISRLMEKNALPHLLLYGPPGTGKT